MAEKQIKDMFGWLNEITLHKTHPKEISQESWKSFNSFMINKYVSMSPDYIELVNYVQRIPYENKQQIYSIYREMIPKRKVFLKYIGSKKKKQNLELADYIAQYFHCSLGEADEYIDILQKKGVRSILYKMGIEDKTIDKLLK
tara:strand:- start:848 stop:1276 length:429 start_codon:yes stop_codon:yes gene_type:complete